MTSAAIFQGAQESKLNGPDLTGAPIAPRGRLGVIPLINLAAPREAVVLAVADACAQWGFFQITGHEIQASKMERIISVTRAFFAQPREIKCRHIRSRENPWGYYDRELTKEQRDRKEIFDVGPDSIGIGGTEDDPFRGTTPWPAIPASFKADMIEWFELMLSVSGKLLNLIGEGLGDSAGELALAFSPTHTSYLRLNHYPVGDPLEVETGTTAHLGIHHHTDAGALTVLLQDNISGLQVYRAGYWHEVKSSPGTFTINIGDMIQIWSNDRYKAPQHRVIAMEKNERISIPFFYNPSYQAEIRPLSGSPKYRPLNWGEFRRKRADGDFADYGTEVQISDWRLIT